MFKGFLGNFLKGLVLSVINSRLQVPTADKQLIVDTANANLPADKQITVEQMDATDSALILYVEGRIEGTLAHAL